MYLLDAGITTYMAPNFNICILWTYCIESQDIPMGVQRLFIPHSNSDLYLQGCFRYIYSMLFKALGRQKKAKGCEPLSKLCYSLKV